MDALSSHTTADSVVQVSLNPNYTRNYSTLPRVIGSYYKARAKSADECIEAKLEVDQKIQTALCQHIGMTSGDEYHLFAVDVTPIARPDAKKLADRGFIHKRSTIKGKPPVTLGHKYSCVAYLTQEKRWALPLSIKRVSTSDKETVFGVQQWCELIKNPENEFNHKMCIGVFDCAYSNAQSIHQVIVGTQAMKKRAIFIARLSNNRVLMRPRNQEPTGRKGRPSWFDTHHPFKLSDSDSWGTPNHTDSVEWTTKRGKCHTVDIQVWVNLRMRGHNDCPIQKTPLTVVQIAVRDQNSHPIYKHPLWLVMVGTWPEHWPVKLFWSLYCARFDIEHFFRLAKQRLLMDVYQTPNDLQSENWMQFVAIAYHQLFHARRLANHLPRKWETKSTEGSDILSPSRVQRDMANVLAQFSKITREVKPRGIPSGRKRGETIGSRPSLPVVRKSPAKPLKPQQIQIILRFKNDVPVAKPRIKYNELKESLVPAEILGLIKKLNEVSPLPTSPPH